MAAKHKTKDENSGDLSVKDYEKLGRELESLYVGFHPSSRKIFWINFFIGVLRGFGTVVGATIGIAILIWVLSLFSHIPLIGHFVENVKETVNSKSAG